MGIPIFTVDAFTSEPFKGNPAGVCLLPAPRDAEWMQHVAREINLSETAFLVPQDGGYAIRWFTPMVEVALCGHATLSSAHILYETGHVAADRPIHFFSKSGPLGASRNGDWLELDFPARPEKPVTPPPELEAALGIKSKYTGLNVDDYLVLVESESAVRSVKPDFARLKELGVRGVAVTAPAETPGFDFVSRFFAPGAGVDEDPVTGSAHCCLGPFWQEQLHKNELLALQVSARSGVVKVRVDGERVLLGGQAVTMLRGELAER